MIRRQDRRIEIVFVSRFNGIPLNHAAFASERFSHDLGKFFTVFWGQPLNYSHVGYLYAFALVACFFGAALFQRLRGSFADVL